MTEEDRDLLNTWAQDLRDTVNDWLHEGLMTYAEIGACPELGSLMLGQLMSLGELCIICRDHLAWDVESFLMYAGLPEKFHEEDITDEDWDRLTQLNGGEQLDLDWNGWDT